METGEEAGKKGDQGAQRERVKVQGHTKGELEDYRWLIVTGREWGHLLLERKHVQTVSEVNKYSLIHMTCPVCHFCGYRHDCLPSRRGRHKYCSSAKGHRTPPWLDNISARWSTWASSPRYYYWLEPNSYNTERKHISPLWNTERNSHILNDTNRLISMWMLPEFV